MPEKKPHARSFRVGEPKPPDPRLGPVCQLELIGQPDSGMVSALKNKAVIGTKLSQHEAEKP